jgi:Na+/melibiose symporter-like transporter
MDPVTREIKLGKRIAFSAGNLSVNLISQAFAAYIVFYYVDVLGVRPALISTAMVIHGIFNAVLNPLIGYVSDRTTTRWGRRVPYMLFGIVPLAAMFTAIWFPIGTGSSLFWYFLFVVLLYDIMFVIVVLNYSALFPELFSSIRERANVSAWKQMMGIVGMILGVAAPPLIYGNIGWPSMGAVFAAVALLFWAVTLTGCQEKHTAHPGSYSFGQAIRYTFSNKSFVLYVIGSFLVQFTFALLPAGIPFFTKYVLQSPESSNTILLGLIFVAAIPFVYVWGKLVQKWGPRLSVLAAVCCYTACLAPFVSIRSITAAAVTAALIGVGLAGLLVLLDVMLSEVIDEDEKRTEERREGMYYGMNGFIVRWGVSLQAGVMGLILESSGYSAGARVQTASAIFGIRTMLSLVPMAALMISLIFFFLYPITKRSVIPQAQAPNSHADSLPRQ